MPLGFIHRQYAAHLFVKSHIHAAQPLGNVLMYGGLTHAELLCRTANSRFVVYYILLLDGGSVLNMLLHRFTPLSVILVLHYMLSFSLIIPLFVLKKNLNAHQHMESIVIALPCIPIFIHHEPLFP